MAFHKLAKLPKNKFATTQSKRSHLRIPDKDQAKTMTTKEYVDWIDAHNDFKKDKNAWDKT